jgi:hypothetical protein
VNNELCRKHLSWYTAELRSGHCTYTWSSAFATLTVNSSNNINIWISFHLAHLLLVSSLTFFRMFWPTT